MLSGYISSVVGKSSELPHETMKATRSETKTTENSRVVNFFILGFFKLKNNENNYPSRADVELLEFYNVQFIEIITNKILLQS
jgi:hypothetical protein